MPKTDNLKQLKSNPMPKKMQFQAGRHVYRTWNETNFI